MIYFVLLVFLCILVLLAIWWKPGKIRASLPSAPLSFVSPSQSESDVDRDIAIITELIRADEAAKRKAAAIERLKSLQASQ